ncbi:energy transducer TonB [Desulfobacter hydrogenophilus]|uniref:Energy transducer TonB n=1 Tax=Desulfobacter hydrogenophilus TaxID=2291 RepID=A0A328F6U4_9BACT|nr:energy transducer TonB [Desulfobacter hydrogenophilus]NDY74499.1 energy transducer TonB [Desulfobacter hydrogenophilus]QBH15170.1 energy transducer TonB [Desulfobacter hydrogenophilus]RAL99945.1 energy transducer TonB [Desulfobacter hydrogenophilus]
METEARRQVRRSYLIQAFFGAALINLALFGILPGLIHMDKTSNDLESLNTVNFIRLKNQPPPPKPKNTPDKKKEPEKAPEKIHRIARQKQMVPKKQLQLNMPALDLDIDPRISGGIPMIAPPKAPVPQTAASDFNAVMDETAVDTIPVPKFKRSPQYPYRAKRMGMEGEVKIRFLVSKEGEVSQIEILESNPPKVFDQSVLNAVSSWKYTPGELMGRKVATRVTTSIIFKLEGQ